MKDLYDKLAENHRLNTYSCHMPGHKQNMDGFPMEIYYNIDITEIHGFDNLHKPEGILKEIMERAGILFGGQESFLLVNGSTGGILSAISAVFRKKEKVLMARNCHKSVYHGIYLNELNPVYVYPEFLENYGICGSVHPEEIERELKKEPDIKGIFLTSPTYDGVVSDVESIVKAAHKRKIPVIVDEAHGAHFALDKRFPESAVECGADIVIHSIHKTLPALTQTALLHVQGDLVDRERLKRFLRIFQTSSPSYILMAGIGQCISILEQKKGDLCNSFFEWNEIFEKQCKNLKHIKIFPGYDDTKNKVFDFDCGKKIISLRGSNLNGQKLYKILLETYGLEMEMAGWDYVTAIMTIMDKKEGFERLGKALTDIDGRLEKGQIYPCPEMEEKPGQILGIYEAMEEKKDMVLLENCAGCISGEFIHIYPPGIPFIVPGECFTKEIAERLLQYRNQEYTIEGLKENDKKVSIIRRNGYA